MGALCQKLECFRAGLRIFSDPLQNSWTAMFGEISQNRRWGAGIAGNLKSNLLEFGIVETIRTSSHISQLARAVIQTSGQQHLNGLLQVVGCFPIETHDKR